MDEIVKHINDTNASYRTLGSGDAKNTDLFLDNDHYELFKDSGEQITVKYNKENLQKAILFISSILPRKYDNSAIHKTIPFSPSFVFDQLAFLEAFFTIDGVKVESRTQVWNSRKDVLKKNGEIDNRFYFNDLLEEVSYTDHNGEQKTKKFTIRNYLAGNYSDLHIKKGDDGIFNVWVTNALIPSNDGQGSEYEKVGNYECSTLQKIYFGTPGSGKSWTIKRCYEMRLEGDKYVEDDEKKKRVIRTTFHPDTDYASFVGCYKPIKDEDNEKKIVYEFVPQAFTDAYVAAWSDLENPYYLIIEEINRGNCAQIFGDLFQLLDRNKDGYSEYPIKADHDLRDYLVEHLPEDSEGIRDGKLCLPPNLSIIASMNTSDQSLFPMDSAFKRRWSWEYVPIDYENAESGTFEITIGGETYNWHEFLKAVNEKIKKVTSSEDKQMGNFFIKASVDEKEFCDKVMFYLWSEVGKDNYQTNDAIFRYYAEEDKLKEFSFNELYDERQRATILKGFIRYIEEEKK